MNYISDSSATVPPELLAIASNIRLLLTDVDGVLTDGSVYYGPEGEVMKRFNIRDGMAVERLAAVGVEVGIITGENSPSVMRRAEKLKIEVDLVVLGCKDKSDRLTKILQIRDCREEEIAYIGDDVNDHEVLRRVGLAAAPSDALPQTLGLVDYVCSKPGGHGAFRELAELIIAAKESDGEEESE